MPKTEILSAHHLPHAVVEVIGHAKKYAVLSTAYLRSWVHLEHALRDAVKRGVQVDMLIRAPDGSKKERDKTEREIKAVEDLGVHVHRVHRLHAKVYLNESEAIVSSFNLVGASQESVEIGVHLRDRRLVEECRKILKEYSESFTPIEEPEDATAVEGREGRCIGCGGELDYNPEKPLCKPCYKASKRGSDMAKLPSRSCHACGSDHKATLDKPLCYACFMRLPPAEKDALKTSVENRGNSA